MIVRQMPGGLKLFFLLQGSIVPRILPQILSITVVAFGVAVANTYFPSLFPDFTLAPLALLGVALSLFLGFRNNACYDRWWEARKQWGQLVVDSRSLVRQVQAYADSALSGSRKDAPRVARLTIAFAHALRHQLRHSEPWDDLANSLETEELDWLRKQHNVADAILRRLSLTLGDSRTRGGLSDMMLQKLEDRITSMATVQASCERIQTTPLPFAYMLLVHRTAYLYCFILPFGMVASQGFMTPVFCAIIGYAFFGLDALGEELEEPFGLEANDLALSAMCRNIEINLLDVIDHQPLPEPMAAEHYRLT